MKLILFLTVLLLTACSCKPIKYSADIGFLNSAQANSMEFLVRLNGSACIDMDKKVGLCAKRIPSDKSLIFSHGAMPYGYRIHLKCSDSIGVNDSWDILPNSSFSYELKPEQFNGVKSFTCIGEVFPFDRDQEVSALWSARIVVYDGNYTPRESAHKSKKYLIMGKHSKYVFYNGKWKNKKPTIKLKLVKGFAYSESEMMRYNYYGLK